jgi:hypothetical protein
MKFFVELKNDKEVKIRMIFKVFNKISSEDTLYKTMDMENKETVAKWFEENIDRNCVYDIHSFYVKPVSVESDKLLIEYKINTCDFDLDMLNKIHSFLLNPDENNKNPFKINDQTYNLVGTYC